jgi:hypothetical protein
LFQIAARHIRPLDELRLSWQEPDRSLQAVDTDPATGPS